MKKIKMLLDCIYSGRSKGFTLCEVREIERIYESCRNKAHDTTIIQRVADVFKTAGMNVKESGIGWSITA